MKSHPAYLSCDITVLVSIGVSLPKASNATLQTFCLCVQVSADSLRLSMEAICHINILQLQTQCGQLHSHHDHLVAIWSASDGPPSDQYWEHISISTIQYWACTTASSDTNTHTQNIFLAMPSLPW